ncbi:MAG: FAD:protein FMN transferase [Acidimicrobiia bacterium]|nr:FAD:protein FMN transferase [Acidimicrobiia bacterium]
MLVVGGDTDLAFRGRARLEQLERRWSRFLPDSELSRLNEEPETPVVVSDDTYLLAERVCAAWVQTDGAFDPTVLDAIEAAGYDATFDELPDDRPVGADGPTVAPGCGGIEMDPVVRTITLPRGVRLDPGGLGKGLAADIVAAELVAAGADGAMVDVGGDLRVLGVPPGGDGWNVGVEDASHPGQDVAQVRLAHGGVATSTAAFRTWNVEGHPTHHLIDPVVSRPVASDLMSVTIAAADAAWAEALSTAVFVRGLEAGRELVDGVGAAACLVTTDGRLFAQSPFEEMAR